MWKKVLAAGLCGTAVWANYSPPTNFIPPSNISSLKLFSGNYSRELSSEIAGILGVQIGRCQLGKYSDGETFVKICEQVEGKDVFLIASLGHPIHDNILEMILMISALKRANCRKVILIIPYLAYNRQDNPVPGNHFSPAEDIPKLIECMEVDSVIGVDFHDPHADGHFTIPVHEIKPYSLAVQYLLSKRLQHPLVISPDTRGSFRAFEFYKLLNDAGIHCDLAVLTDSGKNVSYLGQSNLIGKNLTGRDVIIVDDMVITGGTLLKCVEAVRKIDAEKVYSFVTHPVLPNSSIKNLNQSSLDECICTNSLKLQEHSNKVVQLSIAGLLAEKILEVHSHLKDS